MVVLFCVWLSQNMNSSQFYVLFSCFFQLIQQISVCLFHTIIIFSEIISFYCQFLLILHHFTMKDSVVYLYVLKLHSFHCMFLLQFMNLVLEVELTISFRFIQLQFQILYLPHQRQLSKGHKVFQILWELLLINLLYLLLQQQFIIFQSFNFSNEYSLSFLILLDFQIFLHNLFLQLSDLILFLAQLILILFLFLDIIFQKLLLFCDKLSFQPHQLIFKQHYLPILQLYLFLQGFSGVFLIKMKRIKNG